MLESSFFRFFAETSGPDGARQDRHIFDNRVVGADEKLGTLGFGTEPEQLAAYYDVMFSYYADRLETLIQSECTISEIDSPTSVDEKVLQVWDKRFASELSVYCLRILQGPPDKVICAWYNDLPAFHRWASLAQELIRRFSSEQIAAALGSELPVCWAEEIAIVDRLVGGPGEDGNLLAVLEASARHDRLVEITDNIINRLATAAVSHAPDYRSALELILSVLREEFDVRVCDFLDVRHQEGAAVLDLFATSWAEDDVEAVRLEESAYTFAGGITGSVFLHDRDHPIRWVLTNVLDADERQSRWHMEKYAPLYGRVSAFCVVPVFEGKTLMGAVRLIDPTRLDYSDEATLKGRPGTWPLENRLDLMQVSEWLSTTLPILRVALPGGLDDSALAAVGRHPNWLNWACGHFKAALLRDCARIVAMRDEHRAVSATVVAGTESTCNAYENETTPYHSIPERQQSGSLGEATRLFGRVLPGAGIFVCPEPTEEDAYLNGCQYKSVRLSGALTVSDAVDKLGEAGGRALLHVNGDRRAVHVYERGVWSGDYFVNEKTGRWELRVASAIEAQLESWLGSAAPRHRRFVNAVLMNYAIPYSYSGHGGLLLISPNAPRDQITEPGFTVNQTLKEMSASQFEAIAAVDGGTWIDCQKKVREAGLIFTSGSIRGPGPQGGARHQVAAFLAEAVPDGLVIAISANRPITLFAKGADPLHI
jgi:hypothetical protein